MDGSLRIISSPPEIVPSRDFGNETIDRFASHFHAEDMAQFVRNVLSGYLTTLEPSRRHLVEQYRAVDLAHKAVGVGSVGLQAWIVVMEGVSPEDMLVLQLKEARESVLERYLKKAPQGSHGQRVVDGQRAIQTTGDPLLGWCTLADWRGVTRDFYVRQLWDGKGSVDLENVSENTLLHLGRTCGRTLAKAHARTGNRFVIAGYLGQQEAFETAVADFASAYAELNEQDYRRFVNAVGAAPVPDPA